MKTKGQIKDEIEEVTETIEAANPRDDIRDLTGYRDALFWVLE